ncbi:universal stress protein [Mucilaginibacter sp. SJ]|uniref:universal stress protein n=1 Tax=Mucilaginibacter sp. SJ TaxID=3029053 RepID=UPI0023A932FE|nr:universal stress protein [Mucilaginibacter sp. SJ]WEA01779.1 universal stress protein [Mucilaginibacter sp. SJ]
MRKILIPVDHSTISDNLIAFAAGMNGDFLVEEIILLKTFHIGSVARVLPSADMLLMTPNEIQAVQQSAEERAEQLAELLKSSVSRPVKVRTLVVDGSMENALGDTITNERPDLLMIGNDPENREPEDVVSGVVIALAKLSTVPVLLVPVKARYRKPEKLMIPTSFDNIERLSSFKDLFRSRIWKDAHIHVFHAGSPDAASQYEEQIRTVYGHLQGHRIKFHFRECIKHEISREILNYADEEDHDMIFALPGKHGFFQQVLHKSVTQDFALHADRPVMLLK